MKKKWPIILIIIIILIVTAVIILPRVLGISMVGNDPLLTTVEAEKGVISNQVVSTGNIKQKIVDVKIPYELTMDKVLVKTGDYVSAGDVLGTVTSYSISSAIRETRNTISDLQDEIDSIVKKDSESVYVDSNVEARVKTINAKKGDSAATVVDENGALIILSLDGKMGVKFDSNTKLSIGEKVTVKGETTGEETGTIETINGESYTLTLTDEDGKVDEEVTISKDGNAIGTGKLYVNKPLKITNSVGSVKSINVENNEKVWNGTTLITLSKTTANSNYESLSKRHEEQVNLLEKLNDLSATREIRATESGVIDSILVTEDSEFVKSTSDSSAQGATSPTTPSDANGADDMPGEETPSNDNAATNKSSNENNYEGAAFKISSDRAFSLSVKIDELDVSSITTGLDAIIEFDAIEGESFEGKVYDISTTADVSNGVAKYSATIDIPKSSKMIDGMSASATIIKETKDDILVLPVEATQEDGDRIFVYTEVAEDGTLTGEKEIVTGLSDGTTVEIIEGINAGDTIYYLKEQYTNELMEEAMVVGI